ncbi:unnamed protein product [Paramecium pentaurelia]|uniref:Ankyrin repeat protein n=1 Tax=Paramecium pentaurelia TaxID=43138 RepID=A0A8S1S648_9CILI|nr:unnamed protein product [Paramecium pentaurelia]
MRSNSHQIIGELPQVNADPNPDMQTIEIKKEESTYRFSNTNICNIEQLILHSIYEGNIDQLKSMKIHLRDLNYLEEFSEDLIDKQIFPLALAVATGQLEIVKLLLQNEAIEVNMVSKPQELSALKLACSNGYYEIAELLVQQDANVNQADSKGSVPLFYCFSRLEEETNYFENKQLCFKLAELLIDNGANIDAVVNAEKGYTLLMLFCAVKDKLNPRDLRVNLDVIRFLLSRGASKDKLSTKGKTALQLSKHHCAKDEVQKMLKDIKPTQYKIFSHRPQIIQQQVIKQEGIKTSGNNNGLCCGLLSSSRNRPQSEKSWWQFF